MVQAESFPEDNLAALTAANVPFPRAGSVLATSPLISVTGLYYGPAVDDYQSLEIDDDTDEANVRRRKYFELWAAGQPEPEWSELDAEMSWSDTYTMRRYMRRRELKHPCALPRFRRSKLLILSLPDP